MNTCTLSCCCCSEADRASVQLKGMFTLKIMTNYSHKTDVTSAGPEPWSTPARLTPSANKVFRLELEPVSWDHAAQAIGWKQYEPGPEGITTLLLFVNLEGVQKPKSHHWLFSHPVPSRTGICFSGTRFTEQEHNWYASSWRKELSHLTLKK